MWVEREEISHVDEGLILNVSNGTATGDTGRWFGTPGCGWVNHHGQQKGTQIQAGYYEHALGPTVPFECVDWQPLQIFQKDHNPEFNDQYHGLIPIFPDDYTDVGGVPCSTTSPAYVCTSSNTLRAIRTYFYPHPVTFRGSSRSTSKPTSLTCGGSSSITTCRWAIHGQSALHRTPGWNAVRGTARWKGRCPTRRTGHGSSRPTIRTTTTPALEDAFDNAERVSYDAPILRRTDQLCD